ncbi:MAG: RDD family protein [Cyanobacteria bacterium]|nr:RDD family protein [Cyanobacteria bacterium CG_2015-16_32_12]NCO79570.1 RDD family protein [Cyanobacteria bacterium CG_2015-22_32_23]NCQ03149.1 RDD family protein [Cyanobacteria bacterium CG_2015-09_32_10]NCQ40535.1 RDD family protein [Cyanobacteria bacterium CG_2015-04_32_10]NCS84456.1 RDD family protein [Cyanobacteria bacterium CG_2015-02_32_10]
MYSEEIQYRRSPKAPFDRRGYAFLIDFVVVWIISSLVTNIILEFLIFTLLWLILRVIVVDKNKGQSLGNWAMDLKIVDLKFNRLPSLLSLTKREGIIALGGFLAMIGLKINFQDFLLMILFMTPLILDVLTVFTNDQYNQAFHDRISGTIIIQTKRGFSLDLRLKKLFREARKTWRKNRKND